MSEALDRVRDVKELPLFPLPIVLFPGVPQPLHIFEPRYRKLLGDVRSGNNLFGLSYFDSNTAGIDSPMAGQPGCVADVTDVQALPDGRSNILAVGIIRYRIESYVERDDPYLVARVAFFEDEKESGEQLEPLAHEVTETFMRIARAVRRINDERAALPDLPPTDPEHLSFLIAAAIELDAEIKLELLELRSTSERLMRLHDFLRRAVATYEEKARVHVLAKGNGHAGRELDIE
jgi:ATP-dependent Lon protease